jgi:aminoglycoside phosphotransferase (APT) family kinase protein
VSRPGPQPRAHSLRQAMSADVTSALEERLQELCPGLGPIVEVMRLDGGQSNPTYLLAMGAGRFILRTKPAGELLATAHAIDREYRVLSALGQVGYRVPGVLAFDERSDVLGTPFYLMEHVEGVIHRDASMPDAPPAVRRHALEQAIDMLVALHAIDPVTVGLADFGRGSGYAPRQIRRWTEQFIASHPAPPGQVTQLRDFLLATAPAQQRVTLVHGDYRAENLIHRADGTLLAVLDWELSTIGDPLADLGYFLMHWHLPADGASGLGGVVHARPGLPGSDELAARYARRSGIDIAADLPWYVTYNLFRAACICQGIAGRIAAGNAVSGSAQTVAARVPGLLAAAVRSAGPLGFRG